MPTITYNGKTIQCERGANVRQVLLKAGIPPYNGAARWVNCHGIGSCGTCAVEILRGEVGAKSAMERWRLHFPPHRASSGLRLACQIQVRDDLVVRKHGGFWGQHVGR